MKSVFLLISLTFMLTSFSAMAQTEEIVGSLKSANAEKVASHFDDFIDMKLLEKDEIKNMGKSQATILLKKFFTDNRIQGFEKISERAIGTTRYMTGKLLNPEKGYNITIMFKQKETEYQIVTIRIN
ncbi:MAG: DUF4783 domain-containing protein [Chitinophagaceae bacterium]|nr:DUF4783 domain-containing protein [Chitinophagaceae bacterium]